MIDADLYAKPDHIWHLIDVVQSRRGVAMACASALQNMPDIFGRNGVITIVSLCSIDRIG